MHTGVDIHHEQYFEITFFCCFFAQIKQRITIVQIALFTFLCVQPAAKKSKREKILKRYIYIRIRSIVKIQERKRDE